MAKWVDNPNPKHTSFPAHGSATVTALLLWNQNIITASDDSSIHVYSTEGELVRSLQGHEGGIWALALHGDTLVSGGTDGSTRIWDLQTSNCTHVFRRHAGTVRCVVIAEPEESGTGESWPKQPIIVTGSRDHTLCGWVLPRPEDAGYTDDDSDDVSTSNPYHRFQLHGHEDSIRSISARGRKAASASYDRTVRIWDIVAGQCLFVLRGHTDKGWLLQLHESSSMSLLLILLQVYNVIIDAGRDQVYSGSMDRTVRVWDLSSGVCKHTLSRHGSLVGVLSASPSFLVSGAAEGLVCVWDPQSGDLVKTFEHKYAITAIQHDDTKIISGSDGLVRVLDITNGKEQVLLSDERTRVVSCLALASQLCVAVTKQNTSSVDVWSFEE